VGGGPEKLLTLEDAARRLGLPADDVEAFVRSGKLTAFRLGGHLLRLRQSEVELLRRRPNVVKPTPQDSSGRWDRIVDFFYFNDFYLVALLVALTLLAVIVSL